MNLKGERQRPNFSGHSTHFIEARLHFHKPDGTWDNLIAGFVKCMKGERTTGRRSIDVAALSRVCFRN